MLKDRDSWSRTAGLWASTLATVIVWLQTGVGLEAVVRVMV
jgi:hypothetical protein